MKLKTLLTAMLVCLALASPLAQAQTNAALSLNTNRLSSSARGDRYLLIVETSKAMDKRADGIDHTILDVLGSGLKGQVKRGATLGVWTFNESLVTGKFPLQKWGPDNQSAVATSIVEFLHKQKFEKQGLPEKMIPTLGRVITNSELVTVILISSGNANLQGVGFDSQINGVYQQWRAQQQQKKMPFVTLLRGRHGVLTDYAVAPAPWPVELPPLPPEPVVQAATTAVAQAPAKAQSVPKALYFSGKKTETASMSQPAALTNAVVQTTLAAGGASPKASVVLQTNQPSGSSVLSEFAQGATNAAPTQLAPASDHSANGSTNLSLALRASGDGSATQTSAPVSVSSTPSATAKQHSLPVAAQSSSRSNAVALLPAAAVGPAEAVGSPTAILQTQSVTTTSSNRALFTKSLWLGLAGLFALLLALGLQRWLRQRASQARHVSLITRSLDQTVR